LAEYWAQERVQHDFDWFVHQSTGSSEWRWGAYIKRRFNRLSKLLGPEATRKIRNAAIGSFRKRNPKITNEDWHVFTEGIQEEQEWRDRVFGEHEAGVQEMQNDDELRESETTKPGNTK
jgi:hypothetical protein